MALAVARPTAAEPPRIGLVLGGGGARGAAHIGVLEVLDRLRVPVHCVAGTSMGALVAGAWAAGASTERMRGEMTVADWDDLFQDSPDYRELSLRHKLITRRFLPGSELGFTPQGLSSPPGVVAGEKIKLFLNQLVRADLGEPEIDKLALPVALIATDIGSGERVVFRSGPLTKAMRASMSVPGLMAPTEIGGRRLVDGGLVDNLPVDEVRQLCRPDVVIAVNVGSPLLKADQIGSVLSVTAQMVAILTEQNVQRSIASLQPRDVYIRPDLDGITSADFDRHADAAARGRAAAEAQGTRLAELALPERDYAAWRKRFEQSARVPPQVAAIEITGLSRVNPAVVRRHLTQPQGDVLDSTRLGRDLVRVFGEGDFEGVDYSLVGDGSHKVLRVTPTEKRWGPEYLRMAFALSSTSSQGASYSLRMAWHKTWLNRWGGELLAVGELGNANGATVEWYQPLGGGGPLALDSIVQYRRERFDLYAANDRISEYVLERSGLGVHLGYSLGPSAQVRLGWHLTYVRPSLSTGVPLLDESTSHRYGPVLLVEVDRMNRRYFPTDGDAWRLQLTDNRGGDDGYTRADVEVRHARSFGTWVLGTRLAWVGAVRSRLPVFNGASLGGFLNLSAYSVNQVTGESLAYAHVRGERLIGRMPLGLRGDLRLGAALEVARVSRVYAPTPNVGTLHSLTTYVGGDTPIGPVYLGAGYSFKGVFNAYLFIGAP